MRTLCKDWFLFSSMHKNWYRYLTSVGIHLYSPQVWITYRFINNNSNSKVLWQKQTELHRTIWYRSFWPFAIVCAYAETWKFHLRFSADVTRCSDIFDSESESVLYVPVYFVRAWFPVCRVWHAGSMTSQLNTFEFQ